MKSSVYLTGGCALFAMMLGAMSASAAGLIGQRHARVTYNYTNYDSGAFDSSGGTTVFANTPVRPGKLDVGFDYTTFDQDSDVAGVADRSRTHALLVGTLHDTDSGHVPYFRAGLGWAEWDYGPGDVRDGLAYYAEAGAEFHYIENLRITPYVAWVDTFKTETRGDLHYGARAEFGANERLSVIAGLAGDENYNLTVSFGGAFRF